MLSNKALVDISKLRIEDKNLSSKLWDLILDISKNPYDGIGQPEPLKHEMQGNWSRRISQKHRLIYRIIDTNLEIVSCYGHY